MMQARRNTSSYTSEGSSTGWAITHMMKGRPCWPVGSTEECKHGDEKTHSRNDAHVSTNKLVIVIPDQFRIYKRYQLMQQDL